MKCAQRLESRGGRQCKRRAVWPSPYCATHTEIRTREALAQLSVKWAESLGDPRVHVNIVPPHTTQGRAHVLRAIAKVFGAS